MGLIARCWRAHDDCRGGGRDRPWTLQMNAGPEGALAR